MVQKMVEVTADLKEGLMVELMAESRVEWSVAMGVEQMENMTVGE